MFSAKLRNYCLPDVVISGFSLLFFRKLFLPLQRYITINGYEMSQIDIFEAKSCKPEYVAAVNRLLKQLCSSPCEMSTERLQRIVEEPNSRLLLLAVDGEVMGMCTLGFYTSPTGRKAWMEDLVVDETCRGMHLGERLFNFAADFAEHEGYDTLMLTSRPARVAANRMYQKLGFGRKETNVYLKSKKAPPNPPRRGGLS